MKVALYTISYQGLWYDDKFVSLERLIPKVADFGYGGISLSGKMNHASPLHMDKKACNKIKELANSVNLELVALDTYTNFMDPVIEHREAQLVWLKELIKLAYNLEIKIVKIFAGWMGTTIRDGKGAYDNLYKLALPFFTNLERWNWVKECINEAIEWAEEYDVVLALQNHGPPVRLGCEDTLAMIKEINSDRLKLCLDVSVGCFAPSQQSDDYIAKAVRACRDLVVYSHFNGKFRKSEDGFFIQDPYDIHGITPIGGVIINYESFIRELKKISYNGYLAYEVCGSVMENHQLMGLAEVDRRVKAALGYMKGLIAKT